MAVSSLNAPGGALVSVPRPVPPVSEMPFSVQLHRNQVYSRGFLDAFGWGGGGIVLAQSKEQRIERALDLGSWWVIGLGTPWLMEKVYCKHFNQSIQKELGKYLTPLDGSKISPLQVPLDLLDKATHQTARRAFTEQKDFGAKFATMGLKSIHALEDSALRAKIRKGKLMLMFIDLAMMASKGQIYYWGKNALTQKLSGKSGYSAEFDYTTEEYRKKNSAFYEKTKKARAIASTTIGYGSAVALPLLLYKLLKHETPSGAAGLVGQAKRLIPAFNYTDTVFMSKWVECWHNQFNWMLPSLLSARTTTELVGNGARTNLINFFFFLGDDIMRGGANALSEKFEKKGLEGSLFHEDKKLFGTFRRPRSLYEVYRDHGEDSQIYKVAKRNMWASLGVNAAILSVIAPLVENVMTRKHALADQQKLTSQPSAPSLPPLVTSSLQPSGASADTPAALVIETQAPTLSPSSPAVLARPTPVSAPIKTIPSPIVDTRSFALSGNPPFQLNPSDEVGPISPRL
jgi:hypothetical protein